MPKAKKKLSEEEKQAQFDGWRAGPEFTLLQSIKNIRSDRNLPMPIEITPDLTEKWHYYLTEFLKIGPTFKIKGTIKTFPQETIRTAFFGGVNKRDEKFVIDGVEWDFVDKEHPKNCRHVKNTFIELMKLIEDIDNIEYNNFVEWRKNRFIYKYKEFMKFYKDHIKKDKGHAESKKILTSVLEPLRNLLEAANRLVCFNFSCQNLLEVDERYFQYRADLLQFCEKLQPCLETLYASSKDKLKYCPDVSLIFKKLTYRGWDKNSFESFFMRPLLQSFDRMLANLSKLYSMGPDYWKQPLCANTVFLDDAAEVIEHDFIAEQLFGDVLLRKRSNFMYSSILSLANDNILKSLLIEQDNPVVNQLVAPVLVIRSMDEFNKVRRKMKEELKEKNSEELSKMQKEILMTMTGGSGASKDFSVVETKPSQITPLKPTTKTINKKDAPTKKVDKKDSKGISANTENKETVILPSDLQDSSKPISFELLSFKNTKKVIVPQDLIPSGLYFEEKVSKIDGTTELLVHDDSSIPDLEKRGRLFLWPDLLHSDDHQVFVDYCLNSSYLSTAIFNDIEDYMIIKTLKSYESEIPEMVPINAEIAAKAAQEIKKGIPYQRPPHYIGSIDENREKHTIRYSANPLEESNDPKIPLIIKFVQDTSSKLQKYRPELWESQLSLILKAVSAQIQVEK